MLASRGQGEEVTYSEDCMLSGMEGRELRLTPEDERLCDGTSVEPLLEKDRVSAHIHSAWIC